MPPAHQRKALRVTTARTNAWPVLQQSKILSNATLCSSRNSAKSKRYSCTNKNRQYRQRRLGSILYWQQQLRQLQMGCLILWTHHCLTWRQRSYNINSVVPMSYDNSRFNLNTGNNGRKRPPKVVPIITRINSMTPRQGITTQSRLGWGYNNKT